MDRLELVELKLELEFGIAPEGHTLPPATLNADHLPRLLVSRFGDKHAAYFRFDLPVDIRDALAALGPEMLMREDARTSAILTRHAPSEKLYRTRWYTIERAPEPAEYPDVTIHDGQHVVLIDGIVAAWARTDVENERASEVSIGTAEAFRRRGFGRQVTAAWAAHVVSSGKVAYYSHLLANVGSQAVATSLGLAHLSDEVEYV